MALWLIGLGLHDASDVTLKGRAAVRRCKKVYAEFYTARLMGSSKDEIEATLGCDLTVLERAGVEDGGDALVAEAKTADVALVTAGDPLTATTHTDLVLRCRRAGVPVRIVHAPSIHTAAPGLLGLQHYRFGRTVTVARPSGGWFPTSPLEHLLANRERTLHTLVLLDIQAHLEYFMPAREGLELLLEMAKRLETDALGPDTPAGVVAQAGSLEPTLKTGTIAALMEADLGPPLHTLIIPGALHDVEAEAWASLAL
jgi:diphthine synthase